jgi:leucyl-tRNA synthetase
LDCFSGGNTQIDLSGLSPADRQLHRKTHQTIRRVTESIEKDFHFNTAISGVMELVNQISAETAQPTASSVLREALETVLLLLFPMVPHFCEEMWQLTGHEQPLQLQTWPSFDPAAAEEDELTIVVQVNGKLRGRLTVAADTSEEEIKRFALVDEKVRGFIAGKAVQKIIVVKDKLVNIVIK